MQLGTTSAYAEKRGPMARIPSTRVELPPHTRRRGMVRILRFVVFGTTSAYAEKSGVHPCDSWAIRNYLRIRGEEDRDTEEAFVRSELPPHTRRRGSREEVEATGRGTTSAYAEKRWRGQWRGQWRGNYLRIRGEEGCSCVSACGD